jgi:hypothetical protein
MSSILPARHGLLWHHSLSNRGLNTPPVVRKVVASAYGYAIGVGGVVKAVNDGTVNICATTEAPGWVVAAVERFVSPADGLLRSGPYCPASVSYTGSASLDNPFATVLVCIPCRDQVFEATADTTGTSWATAQTYVGEYCNIVYTASVDTVSGMSGVDIDISTHTTSGQFAIVDVPVYGLGQNNMNDPSAAGYRVLVTVNPSELRDVGI